MEACIVVDVSLIFQLVDHILINHKILILYSIFFSYCLQYLIIIVNFHKIL